MSSESSDIANSSYPSMPVSSGSCTPLPLTSVNTVPDTVAAFAEVTGSSGKSTVLEPPDASVVVTKNDEPTDGTKLEGTVTWIILSPGSTLLNEYAPVVASLVVDTLVVPSKNTVVDIAVSPPSNTPLPSASLNTTPLMVPGKKVSVDTEVPSVVAVTCTPVFGIASWKSIVNVTSAIGMGPLWVQCRGGSWARKRYRYVRGA